MTLSRLRLEKVRPIQPLRVLLAGRDERFLRVASFLLARNGYTVETTPKLGDVAELVEQRRPNVVVLDVGGGAAAARAAAAVQGLDPMIGLLLVADDADGGASSGFTTLSKWAPIEKLVEAVALAYLQLPRRAQSAEPLGEAG